MRAMSEQLDEKAECGHRGCAGDECPKCGTPPCCWHRDDCDNYRRTPPQDENDHVVPCLPSLGDPCADGCHRCTPPTTHVAEPAGMVGHVLRCSCGWRATFNATDWRPSPVQWQAHVDEVTSHA